MKIYDYRIADVVEISDAQYDFMQAVIKTSGRLEETRKEYPITEEQLKAWELDPVFSSVLESHLTVLYRSRGLTPEYIKSYLLSTLDGKREPSKAQMAAINSSVKALGLGLAPRQGFSGNITATPENISINFTETIDDGDKPK